MPLEACQAIRQQHHITPAQPAGEDQVEANATDSKLGEPLKLGITDVGGDNRHATVIQPTLTTALQAVAQQAIVIAIDTGLYQHAMAGAQCMMHLECFIEPHGGRVIGSVRRQWVTHRVTKQVKVTINTARRQPEGQGVWQGSGRRGARQILLDMIPVHRCDSLA